MQSETVAPAENLFGSPKHAFMENSTPDFMYAPGAPKGHDSPEPDLVLDTQKANDIVEHVVTNAIEAHNEGVKVEETVIKTETKEENSAPLVNNEVNVAPAEIVAPEKENIVQETVTTTTITNDGVTEVKKKEEKVFTKVAPGSLQKTTKTTKTVSSTPGARPKTSPSPTKDSKGKAFPAPVKAPVSPRKKLEERSKTAPPRPKKTGYMHVHVVCAVRVSQCYQYHTDVVLYCM